MSVDTKSFEGGFLLFRRDGPKLRRKYAGSPRYRHATRAGAEAEAERLLALFPSSTFVVLQEIGTVKAVPAHDQPKGTSHE